MLTVVMLLDIRVAFNSADRPALWTCVVRNGVPGKRFHSESFLSVGLGDGNGLWTTFPVLCCLQGRLASIPCPHFHLISL